PASTSRAVRTFPWRSIFIFFLSMEDCCDSAASFSGIVFGSFGGELGSMLPTGVAGNWLRRLLVRPFCEPTPGTLANEALFIEAVPRSGPVCPGFVGSFGWLAGGLPGFFLLLAPVGFFT